MEKKRIIWKTEKVLEKLNTISLLLATEATIYGKNWRGLAVAANETMYLTNSLSNLVEEFLFEELSQKSFLTKVKKTNRNIYFLALNIILESRRADTKKGELWAAEIKKISEEIEQITTPLTKDKTIEKHFAPAIISNISSKREMFFSFDIGGHTFVENLAFVQEFCPYREIAIKIDNNTIKDFRGVDIPFVNLYKKENLAFPTDDSKMGIIILAYPLNPEKTSETKLFAVSVDKINQPFLSRIGRNTKLKNDDISADLIRECWHNGENSEQILFINWRKFQTLVLFEEIVKLTNEDIQKILRGQELENLSLALKGVRPSVSDKIFNNMSKRASELIKKKIKKLGVVSLDKVEDAQEKIIQIANNIL